MRSRNYTKEIGVTTTERQVPAAVAFAILALVAVVAIYFIRQVLTSQPAEHGTASSSPEVQVASR